jgi:hypothetical protein
LIPIALNITHPAETFNLNLQVAETITCHDYQVNVFNCHVEAKREMVIMSTHPVGSPERDARLKTAREVYRSIVILEPGANTCYSDRKVLYLAAAEKQWLTVLLFKRLWACTDHPEFNLTLCITAGRGTDLSVVLMLAGSCYLLP